MQFMDSFVFMRCKTYVWDGKNRGDNAEKEGAGFGRQSQIKKKQPQRVKKVVCKPAAKNSSVWLFKGRNSGFVRFYQKRRNGENDNRRKGPPGGWLCGI